MVVWPRPPPCSAAGGRAGQRAATDDGQRRAGLLAFAQVRQEVLGQGLVRLGIVLLDVPLVTERRDERIDRQAAQQRRAGEPHEALSLAGAEYLVPRAVRQIDVAHVLD